MDETSQQPCPLGSVIQVTGAHIGIDKDVSMCSGQKTTTCLQNMEITYADAFARLQRACNTGIVCNSFTAPATSKTVICEGQSYNIDVIRMFYKCVPTPACK